MRASAHLTVSRSPGGRCRIARLRSEPPLVLRPTNPTGPAPLRRWNLHHDGAVWASAVGGAAGPLGGDDLRLRIDVEAGAALVLGSVAAMLVLPGPHGGCSRSEVAIRVAAGGALVWLPNPTIAARGCRHRAITRVDLEPGARLLLREELLLGRHAEPPGAVRQRLRVCLDGRPLLDQEIAAGPEAPGWDGAAVTGGRRALGSVLVVDPDWDDGSAAPPSPADSDRAILPLAGPAVLVTALAGDAPALRRRLDAGIAAIEAALPGSRPRT